MQLAMIPMEECRDLLPAAHVVVGFGLIEELRIGTMETPSTGKHARPMTGKSGWLSWYVSSHGMDMVHKVYGELRSREAEPFSGWQR